MDNDPNGLDLSCLKLLRYAEAKKALDNADTKDSLKAWEKSKVMEEVKRNTMALHKARIRARIAQMKKETPK